VENSGALSRSSVPGILFFILLISHAGHRLATTIVFSVYRTIWPFGEWSVYPVVVSIGAWNKTPPCYSKAAILITVLLATTAIGYALFEELGIAC